MRNGEFTRLLCNLFKSQAVHSQPTCSQLQHIYLLALVCASSRWRYAFSSCFMSFPSCFMSFLTSSGTDAGAFLSCLNTVWFQMACQQIHLGLVRLPPLLTLYCTFMMLGCVFKACLSHEPNSLELSVAKSDVSFDAAGNALEKKLATCLCLCWRELATRFDGQHRQLTLTECSFDRPAISLVVFWVLVGLLACPDDSYGESLCLCVAVGMARESKLLPLLHGRPDLAKLLSALTLDSAETKRQG